VLIAYGDDSADETRSRVFAAGAVVAGQDDWDVFLPRWLEKNPKERPFHATDCDSDRGDFKARKHEENKRLYADNVRLFVNSLLIGAAVSVSIKDYWEIFPFAPDDKLWPYYICFTGVLACICRVAQVLIPPEGVKVIFDKDPAKELDTGRIFDLIAKHPDGLPECLAGRVGFGDHREVIGLQVADLLARESMKELDNEVQGSPRWPRQSLIELRRSMRFDTVQWNKAKLEAHAAMAEKLHGDPARAREFREWLSRNGLRDSIHARLHFLAERGR